MYIDVLKGLSKRIYTTKDARFNASKRMARSGKASKACEVLLSASIIAISLIAMQMDNVHVVRIVSSMTIVLSTFVLVFSQLFDHLAYDKRYVNYHNCGMELDRLFRELDNTCYANLDEYTCRNLLISFTNRYESIIRNHNLNHIEIDYLCALDRNSDVKVTKWIKAYHWLRFNVLDIYMLYWLIAVIPMMNILLYYIKEIFLMS